MSFYLLVEGKVDPSWGERLSVMEKTDELQEIHGDLKESVAEIRRQVNQAKRTQWMRRSSMSRDIIRNESLAGKNTNRSTIHVQ